MLHHSLSVQGLMRGIRGKLQESGKDAQKQLQRKMKGPKSTREEKFDGRW